MRKQYGLPLMFLVATAALGLCACDLFRDSSTNVIVTQGQGQTGTTASPSPGPSIPPGICPPVESVNAHVLGASVLGVGEQAKLDATPQRSIELDPDAAKACDLAAGVSWSAPAFPCKLLDQGSFNPILTSESPGTCTTAATVQGHTSPDVTVEFR